MKNLNEVNANNLTTSVSLVLNNPNVREGFKISKIESANLIASRKSKSGFEATYQIGQLLQEATDYFKTKECKQIFAANQLDWKIEDLLIHLGYSEKSFAYKLMKANKLGAEFFEDGTTTKDQLYVTTSRAQYSISDFIKFAQGVQKDKVKVENKLTLTFGKAKLSIDEKDELKTELTSEQIKAVITLLTRKLSTMA